MIITTVVLFVLLLPATAFSQKKKIATYKGAWEGGTAEYTYYTNPESGNRVLHGKYKWVQSNGSMTHTRQGQYADGDKVGKWNYRVSGTMRGGGRVIEVDNQTVGSYETGYPDGPWTINTKASGAGNGESGSASVVGKANFSRGTFVGTMSYVYKVYGGEDYSVVGHFDDDGWMDGTWELNYLFQISNERISEIREYRHGFLITALITNRTTGEVYPKQTNHRIQDALNKIDAGEEVVPFKIDKYNDKYKRDKAYGPDLEHDLNEIGRIKIGSEYLSRVQSAFEGEEKDIAKYLFGFALRDIVSTGPKTTASDTARFVALWFARVNTFMQNKKYQLAESEYTRMLEFPNIDSAIVFRSRARAHMFLNHYKEAIDDVDRYISAYPDSADGYGWRGWYLLMESRYAESIEASIRAQQLGDSGCWLTSDILLARLCNGEISLATSQYIDAKNKLSKECNDVMISDLKLIVDRNIKVAEAKAVLKKVFGITYSPKPK